MLKNNRNVMILFVSWFFYSAVMLGLMALEDKTPPHCLMLKNTENVL